MKSHFFKILLLIIANIVAIYEIIFLVKNIAWDSSKTIGVIVFCFSVFIIVVAVVTYLMSQDYKSKKYYISFPYDLKNDIKKFRANNYISDQFGTDRLTAGGDIILEVQKQISRCSVCLVFINKKVGILQKIEIKTMKKYNKKIIPIVVDDSKTPSILGDIVFINANMDSIQTMDIDELISSTN